jgi:CheY-like chemotaxis protein
MPLVAVTRAVHGREGMSWRVLIVEDDQDSADSLAEVFAARGYEVTVARDGRDALDRVRASGRRPDVILLDILMPVMDGLAFLAARSSEPLLARVPVIVMTAHRTGQSPSDIFARIDKPLALPVVFDTVKRALEGSAGGRRDRIRY